MLNRFRPHTTKQIQKMLLAGIRQTSAFYSEGLSSGEREPWQNAAIELFVAMSQSVPAIPAETLEKALAHRERVGDGLFIKHLGEAISSVGRTSFPQGAAEFLDLLNHDLDLVER